MLSLRGFLVGASPRSAIAAACATLVLSAVFSLGPALASATAAPLAGTNPDTTIRGSAGGPGAATSGQQATSSIVGGNETTADKYPWFVQFRINTEDPGGIHRCGGSLIHPMVILTAAHCFFDNSGVFVGSPPYDRTLTAFTGRTMRDSGGEPLELANFYLAPDYDGPAALNDFALVTLAEPINGPMIKVAGPDERALWKTGRTAIVAGFGLTAIGGSLSPVLKELEVPLVADSVCSSPNSYGRVFNSESMLCAGYMEGGKDSCFGDSGGPLYTPIDGDGVRLIGIVSTGISCAQPNLPGIYTRISEPEITSAITSMIAEIEVLEAFPEATRGLAVVGSGGKPPGCGAASRQAARARAAVRSAGRKVQRAKKIVARNQERLGKAGSERKQAAKRLASSRKKLKLAVRTLAKARAISKRASAAALAASD